MGQHTWFYKDKELRKKEIELWEKLNSYDSNETMLSPSEIDKIYFELAEVSVENKTEYHNIFRTSKRKEDNTYIDDVIQSKEECDRLVKDGLVYGCAKPLRISKEKNNEGNYEIEIKDSNNWRIYVIYYILGKERKEAIEIYSELEKILINEGYIIGWGEGK